MSSEPVLLVGGSGVVGRWTARSLREGHPDTPITRCAGWYGRTRPHAHQGGVSRPGLQSASTASSLLQILDDLVSEQYGIV